MISDNPGIGIAQPNRDMRDGKWLNDSRLPKLLIDLDKDPPHVDVIETLAGGTKWFVGAGQVKQYEETLFEIEHKLPFKPTFYCYFYTKDVPSGFSASIGQYTFQHAFMLSNAIGLGEEGLYAGVTDTTFYIKHFLNANPLSDTTFYGSDFKYRIRFELINREALYTGTQNYT
jgi:hypothetical protein